MHAVDRRAGDLNSGCDACSVNTLQTEPFPQHLSPPVIKLEIEFSNAANAVPPSHISTLKSYSFFILFVSNPPFVSRMPPLQACWNLKGSVVGTEEKMAFLL